MNALIEDYNKLQEVFTSTLFEDLKVVVVKSLKEQKLDAFHTPDKPLLMMTVIPEGQDPERKSLVKYLNENYKPTKEIALKKMIHFWVDFKGVEPSKTCIDLNANDTIASLDGIYPKQRLILKNVTRYMLAVLPVHGFTITDVYISDDETHGNNLLEFKLVNHCVCLYLGENLTCHGIGNTEEKGYVN